MAIRTSQSDDVRPRPLRGKTCLVTGASRGIGRAIAVDLAEHGADVAINYRASTEEAKHVANAIENLGESTTVVQSDVADLEEVEEMAEIIRSDLGTVDVLVNNAGVTADSKFETMTRAEWERVIEINLGGAFNCTTTFFDDIRAADHGRLINIGSVVGQGGNFGQANYAASKSGLFGFTRTLALELAQSGATANCVAPGFTETEMLADVPDRIQERIRARIPMNRFGKPKDIACTVRFLAGEESGYITGQIIGINGGMEW